MASLFTELKRRNVFRVAIAYLVVAWVALEVAEILIPIMKLPDWTLALVLFLGIVGFPFALVFAWAFELTPEGIKRAEDVAPGEASSGLVLNRIIIGLLGLAVILLLADRLLLDEPAEYGPAEVETATAEEQPKSIAVLAFVNMSNDPEQEYFSDGISEEILIGLGRLKDLRVAARTSAFSFKGQNIDIKEIGEKLDVETVLEGSVRKSGERLRITAQLINVADGYHLWSGTFDRELDDLLAIQDEISAAIVSALRVHLGDEETLPAGPAVDYEAYNYYLKAKANLALRTEASLQLALEQYQKAIDIEPTYAAAWAGKAECYAMLSEVNYGNMPFTESRDKTRQMVEMALSLDPDQWHAHALQRFIGPDPWMVIASLERAIAANPSEGLLYSWRYTELLDLGQINEANASLRQAYRVDPLHYVIRMNMAMQLAREGNKAEAYALIKPDSAEFYEFEASLAGDESRWADQIRALEQGVALPDNPKIATFQHMMSDTYYWALKEPAKAREYLVEGSGRAFVRDMYEDPAGAYPTLKGMLTGGQKRIAEYLLPTNLLLQGLCEEMLDWKYLQDFVAEPIRGGPWGGDVRPYGLYRAYAWCLYELGRAEESKELAQRMQTYIDDAIINGLSQGYQYNQAVIHILLEDKDAAMASLQRAWDEFGLNWYSFERPWMRVLQDREDLQTLKQRVHDHTNAERAKLGMEPAPVPVKKAVPQ